MLECWWTLIFAQLSIPYCLNRRNKLIFQEKRLSLPTTQARFLIGPLHWPLIGPPIWPEFWKRFQAWYREVLLRQVTDGVVYSSNRDSFVNWDMTLGTKWTAEEYTNSQGTVKRPFIPKICKIFEFWKFLSPILLSIKNEPYRSNLGA